MIKDNKNVTYENIQAVMTALKLSRGQVSALLKNPSLVINGISLSYVVSP